jgi:hypothetical protein
MINEIKFHNHLFIGMTQTINYSTENVFEHYLAGLTKSDEVGDF